MKPYANAPITGVEPMLEPLLRGYGYSQGAHSGSYDDDGAEVEATALIGKHRIRF